MTKDVMISIRGIQFDNGQGGEKIESIQMGEYYNKNNTHYILFDEADTTKELVAVITLKNENNKYMVLSENMKFYIDESLIKHTNGNASYIVIDGLAQERMESENILKIDFSDIYSSFPSIN